jgi:2-amino-4-hydroxy-6-hydroxymethyldihydropteridine diphosphokinase
MTDHIAYISVGSNMGDKLGNCRAGIDQLLESSAHTPVGQAPYYRTAPVDYLDQDWFVNSVVKIRTRNTPLELLSQLQSIEARAGRTRSTVRFGPRVLDMDILLFDDLVLDASELVIPHPRMHRRRFVLQPICDIDPEVVHPVLNRKMRDLLDRLDDENQKLETI